MTNMLFRLEAIEANKNKTYGHVFLNTPVSYTVICAGLGVLTLGLILFILFAECSEQCQVKGYLNTTPGIANIYIPHHGLVLKRYVHPGDHVQQGDRLFLIDITTDGSSNFAQDATLNALIQNQKLIEHAILEKKQELQSLKKLLEKKYISFRDYANQHDALITLQQQHNQVMLELVQQQKKHAMIIRSPISGSISQIMYDQGQWVHASKPLASVLPQHHQLIAELDVPVTQARFLNHKKSIILHYDAYPYQQFGDAKGHIIYISPLASTNPSDEQNTNRDRTYYKVIAHIDTPEILLYGKKQKLRHGMTFSAILTGPQKKIWQAIFKPLSQNGVLRS